MQTCFCVSCNNFFRYVTITVALPLSYRGLLRAIPSKPNTDRRCNIAIGTNISCPWLSSRPISRRQLCTLLCLHPAPIYPVLSRGTCGFRLGYLILRGASRLDAFSAYPCRAWLPCRGGGPPTGAPAARPSRSSRTGDGSPQVSRACAG